MFGAIAGQLTVGRYVLQIGEPWGAMVEYVRSAAHQPQAHPILFARGPSGTCWVAEPNWTRLFGARPAARRGQRRAWHRQNGASRYLAHHPWPVPIPDGPLYLQAHQCSSDLFS